MSQAKNHAEQSKALKAKQSQPERPAKQSQAKSQAKPTGKPGQVKPSQAKPSQRTTPGASQKARQRATPEAQPKEKPETKPIKQSQELKSKKRKAKQNTEPKSSIKHSRKRRQKQSHEQSQKQCHPKQSQKRRPPKTDAKQKATQKHQAKKRKKAKSTKAKTSAHGEGNQEVAPVLQRPFFLVVVDLPTPPETSSAIFFSNNPFDLITVQLPKKRPRNAVFDQPCKRRACGSTSKCPRAAVCVSHPPSPYVAVRTHLLYYLHRQERDAWWGRRWNRQFLFGVFSLYTVIKSIKSAKGLTAPATRTTTQRSAAPHS